MQRLGLINDEINELKKMAVHVKSMINLIDLMTQSKNSEEFNLFVDAVAEQEIETNKLFGILPSITFDESRQKVLEFIKSKKGTYANAYDVAVELKII